MSQPLGQQPARGLLRYPRIGREGRHQHCQLIGRGILDIEQNAVAATDLARAAGQIAEWLLTNLIAELAGQLPRLFE